MWTVPGVFVLEKRLRIFKKDWEKYCKNTLYDKKSTDFEIKEQYSKKKGKFQSVRFVFIW